LFGALVVRGLKVFIYYSFLSFKEPA